MTRFNQKFRFGIVWGMAVVTAAFGSLAPVASWSQEPSTATSTSLSQSVGAALEYNPRLKVLVNNRDAIDQERQRAFGGYFPSVDLSLGYGTESYDDQFTRSTGQDDDFESRTEASVRLTQLLFDGGETSSRVGIESERLQSARMRVFDNAEAIALDAIIAHLGVYQQQELVALAERNVKDHQDILGMLEDRQKGGAGSIAEVSQTDGRLALARSTLALTKGELEKAVANYVRVVGREPGNIEFPFVPQEQVPKSLNEALEQARAGNPKILALGDNVDEAVERIFLSNASFFPKINLELSSTYNDQLESSQTYEHGNQAMVRLRWNLLNGGSDIADRRSAVSRKHQAASSLDDQIVQVLEETRITWAEFQTAKARVVSFGDAVTYTERTLDAYLKQFNVGQRTLLDVLDARNELFQSSGLLVTARANEVIAFHRLLALGGNLNQTLGIAPELYLKEKAAYDIEQGTAQN